MAARRLPVVTGKAAVMALQRVGFEVTRIRGSHHVLLHRGPPMRIVSVPVHGNHTLPPGTLSAILREAGVTVEEFASLL